MFDLRKFYEDAHEGRSLDVAGLVEYLGRFRSVYLWGAGNLGSAIGMKLLELGVKATSYWDARHADLGTLHGLDVCEPFQSASPMGETAVIFCITSSFVREHCMRELARHGFDNMVRGDFLYEGLVCGFDDVRQFKACRDATACDVYTCLKNETFHKRYLNLQSVPAAERLYFKNVTFVINQRCTLKCKHCYSYTNAYSKEARVNFETARILADIDVVFDSVDGVKIVPLIGGETFLHPDLGIVVAKFLEKKNFGVLNVTTNGIVNIHERQLEGLQDDRVQVVFSNYKTSLTSRECDVFDRNLEVVRASGAHVKVLNETPLWNVPTTLWDRRYPLEIMREKREACLNPLNCKYVKNGKFFPCTVADSIHNIGIADYPEDYVSLEGGSSRDEIRARILSLLARDYFDSCRHCDGVCGTTGVTAGAGEQGYYEVRGPGPDADEKRS
jgi:hypothetical protein